MPLAINHFTVTTAVGVGNAATWLGVREGRSGLTRCKMPYCEIDAWVGEVPACDTTPLPAELQRWDCRNNRLAELALQQDGLIDAVSEAIARFGADRVGLFLGTSTSGTTATEDAYRAAGQTGRLPDIYRYDNTHDVYSVAGYVQARLGLQGMSLVISTACSSSAKVFASAARVIAAGFCDAAVVGGVDSLCLTTVQGFHALQLVSDQPCRPCDIRRNGISIGEAAGFALVSPLDESHRGACLLGWGESSDAYHMSSPEPEGRGAEAAIRQALSRAALTPDKIDHVNLHGTGTPANDAAEAHALRRVFGPQIPVASTKGWTGHTLGAAGIVEAALGWHCLRDQWMPQNLNLENVDPALGIDVLMAPRAKPLRHVLSNSFGFGGSNCALVLGWRS